MVEHVRERRRLRAGEGEACAVGDVDSDDAARGETRHHQAVELGTGHVRGRARTREDVDDHEVDDAVEPARQLRQHLAGIAVTDAQLRAAGERQVLAHEVDEIGLELDDLLARPGSRGDDVAGQGERTAAEVHGRDRLALGAHEVDGVPDAPHVLESEPLGPLELDVRLRCAVDEEGP